MKSFNCSINRTIQAETEEEAVEIFKDMVDGGWLLKEVQVFAYPPISNWNDNEQPN